MGADVGAAVGKGSYDEMGASVAWGTHLNCLMLVQARSQASLIIAFLGSLTSTLCGTDMGPEVPQVIDRGAGRGLTATPATAEARQPTVTRLTRMLKIKEKERRSGMKREKKEKQKEKEEKRE